MAHGHKAEEEEEAGPKLVMPEELSCPICFKLMTDPVVAEDGQTYQRHAIEEWINKCIAGTVSAHGGWYRNPLGKCGMSGGHHYSRTNASSTYGFTV
jgi:hypothetical protein